MARYIAKFAMLTPGADIMWDEITAAAWLDPSIITRSETRYMSVDVDHGAAYGNTLTWDVNDPFIPRLRKSKFNSIWTRRSSTGCSPTS